jgi:hypothetical protein
MELEHVEMLAKAIREGLHEVAEAIRYAGASLGEDMSLGLYVYQGLERAARIIKRLDE